MAWSFNSHTDRVHLAEHVAAALQAACVKGVANRGAAMLALAGGQTPWPLYRRLADANLPWADITLVPTDERCVRADSPASNLLGLVDAFGSANGVRLASLTVPDGAPDASLVHACEWLGRHPQSFDAVVLGMGNDGHTASLFPRAPELAAGFDPALDACRVDPVPLPQDAPYPRISLTVARLLRAEALYLVITGAAKRAALEEAITANDPWRHPIMALLGAPEASIQVHWSP